MVDFSKARNVISNVNIIGLILRAGAMLGKFLLIFFLSKELSLEALGTYGIFISSIVIVNYIQGLEFHAYTGREILQSSQVRRSLHVGNQTVVHIIVYLILLPLIPMIFWAGFLDWELIGLFYWIAVATHLGTEISRLLIVISRTNQAYLISFLIHGLWAYLAILLLFQWPEIITLKEIFICWGISATLGVGLGIIFLWMEKCIDFSLFSVNKDWIFRGLKTSYTFFIGVLAYKTIELSDRYFLQYYHGEADVGVYTFYASVANVVQEIVFSGMVVLIFPLLVSSYKRGDITAYSLHISRLRKSVIFGSGAALLFVCPTMYLLLALIEKPLFIEKIVAFGLLLLSVVIINLSLVPHYTLYANDRDKELMLSVIVAMLCNVILNILLIPNYGMYGAAVATVLSFSAMALLKTYFARKLCV